LKAVFDQIQAAEKNGNLSEAERKKLEEQAAEKGLSTLFKVNRRHLLHSFPSLVQRSFNVTLRHHPHPHPHSLSPCAFKHRTLTQ
jgi:hypothetical protein